MKESILAQNLKIKVNTPSESERAQRAFFALGYKWASGDTIPIFLDKKFLIARPTPMDEYAMPYELRFAGYLKAYLEVNAKEISLPKLEAIAGINEAENDPNIEAESEGLNSFEIKTDGIYLRNGRHYHFEAGKYDDFGEMICNSKGVVIEPISPAEMVVPPPPTKESEALTTRQKFFAYWMQEHNIQTLESDFWEMERLFESEAQKRYNAAEKLLDECGFYASGDYSDTAYKAIAIAAGLPAS